MAVLDEFGLAVRVGACVLHYSGGRYRCGTVQRVSGRSITYRDPTLERASVVMTRPLSVLEQHGVMHLDQRVHVIVLGPDGRLPPQMLPPSVLEKRAEGLDQAIAAMTAERVRTDQAQERRSS